MLATDGACGDCRCVQLPGYLLVLCRYTEVLLGLKFRRHVAVLNLSQSQFQGLQPELVSAVISIQKYSIKVDSLALAIMKNTKKSNSCELQGSVEHRNIELILHRDSWSHGMTMNKHVCGRPLQVQFSRDWLSWSSVSLCCVGCKLLINVDTLCISVM